ncbi:MAG: FKBP-type peptidyl-prolyl cis-trans isomerase, partial [Candidatus Pacearchaeota archaeon]
HEHPLEFVAGEGHVVAGFDKAVIGMSKGEEKEFTIKPSEAYGERNPDLEQKVPRSQLPKEQEPEVGMVIVASTPEGEQFPVQIIAVDSETVTLDLNHPLAGKTLVFKIKILDVNHEKGKYSHNH